MNPRPSLLSRLFAAWWKGMTLHARNTVRAETEALERYRDVARGGHPSSQIKRTETDRSFWTKYSAWTARKSQ